MLTSTFLAIALPGFIKGKLISLLFAAIPVGAVAFVLYQLVKRFTGLVDAIKNPWIHRAVVTIIAMALTALAGATGLDIVCVPGENCLNEVNQEHLEFLVQSGLAALSAMLMHASKKGSS